MHVVPQNCDHSRSDNSTNPPEPRVRDVQLGIVGSTPVRCVTGFPSKERIVYILLIMLHMEAHEPREW